mmetsp:Transcript_7080/g.25881  ORF Transcript_7080/g.25881 Transcript_7080/m.25881 type:complete len:278 (+) Transcript_7080:297-1130(+)
MFPACEFPSALMTLRTRALARNTIIISFGMLLPIKLASPIPGRPTPPFDLLSAHCCSSCFLSTSLPSVVLRASASGMSQVNSSGTRKRFAAATARSSSPTAMATHKLLIAMRALSSSSLYNPWSRSTTCVSPRRVGCSLTRTLPGWGSPCTNECTRSILANASLSASAACFGSRPNLCIEAMSVTFVPCTNSIVKTRFRVTFHSTEGASMRSSSANARFIRSQLRPSASKSISFSNRLLNSSTMNPKSNDGNANFVKNTRLAMVLMSLSIVCSSPGR